METGIAAQIRRKYPNYYTTAEAARLVGKSTDTLRRWRKNKQFVPSETVKIGQLDVHLYTLDDMNKLHEFSAQQRPGRKRKRP